jgi:hypothetical protein
MKIITKLKTIEKELPIDGIWAVYIFSYLHLFLVKNKLFNEMTNEYVITNNLLEELEKSISTSLLDILNVSYIEPPTSEYKKYPTRFEKILLDGKIYKVNYRMSINGRLAYAIYCMINFIAEAKSKNLNIVLEPASSECS